MQGSERPLILGAATSYTPEQVAPFFESLVQSGYAGKTVILVDAANHALRDYLTARRIGVISLDATPRWMPEWLARRRTNGGRMQWVHKGLARFSPSVPAALQAAIAAEIAGSFHHISNRRYFEYFRFLRRAAHDFSHVFLADVRDIAFQANPFQIAPENCLWFFQENVDYTLGTEPCNARWLRLAYGAEAAQEMSGDGILCSGTTMGPTALVLAYLRRMTAELVRLTPLIRGTCGFDQAVHNRLYRAGVFPAAEVKTNFAGPVATLQLEQPERFVFDDEGRLLNRDGTPVPVLHQYDRHPELEQRVRERILRAEPR